jgi:nucleoside-diphosphate-sugar epimerase
MHAESIDAALHGIDTVIHLAGLTCAVNVEQLELVNRQGSRNVAAACAAMNESPTLVYVSSVAAAGPVRLGELLNESMRPHPVSDYGRSKLLGERAVQEFADRVPISIVRPAIVFGERDLALLELMKTIITFRVVPAIGRTAPPTNLIYVHDLVQLLCSTVERGRRLAPEAEPASQQGIYFAASDEVVTLTELGQQLAELLRPGRVTWTVPIPVLLARGVAACSEFVAARRGQAAVLNRDKVREAVVPSWACSNQAAKCDLGFEPTGTVYEQLRTTVKWYRENNWL